MLDSLGLIWKKVQKPFLYVCMAVPFIIYVCYVYLYAANLPIQDDYDAVLAFLTSFKHANFSTRLHLLFMQHNEHRLLSSRIVFALYYQLFGDINFRHIIMLNVLIFLSLFSVIASFIRQILPNNWHLPVVILSTCVFDLNNYENMNFAMAGMQNIGVVLLFAASMYCYNKTSTKVLPAAAVLHILCIFSSGNGIIASFFLLVFALLLHSKPKIIVAGLIFLLVTPLYYYNYAAVPPTFFTLNPFKVIPYFLEATGAHFNKELGVLAGILLLSSLVILLPVKQWFVFHQGTLPLVGLLVFCLSSLAAMSVYRSAQSIWFAYSSRYFIYTHIITAIVFALFVFKFQGKNVRGWTTFLTLLLIFVAIRNYNDGHVKFASVATHARQVGYDYPNKEHAKKIAEEACKENIYCIQDNLIK